MRYFILSFIIFVSFMGCAGEDGTGCTLTNNEDGTYLVFCPNGTSIVLRDGEQGLEGVKGESGESCTVSDEGEEYKITCEGANPLVIPKDLKIEEEPILHGSYIVRNQADINYLNNYITEITGNLIFECYGLSEINLSNIIEVKGDITIMGISGLVSISMESLEVLGNLKIKTMDDLDSIDFPKLTSITGYLMITDNDLLNSIDFSVLATVGGDFAIINNDLLNSIDFSVLATVGGYVTINENNLLSQCDIDALELHVSHTGTWESYDNFPCL